MQEVLIQNSMMMDAKKEVVSLLGLPFIQKKKIFREYELNHVYACAGTMVTAAAHIITSVIGSGVLSLAWAVAQLGWLAATVCLVIFSLVTLFTSHLLSDCYRNPVTGKRNYSYMDVVNSNLGKLVSFRALTEY